MVSLANVDLTAVTGKTDTTDPEECLGRLELRESMPPMVKKVVKVTLVNLAKSALKDFEVTKVLPARMERPARKVLVAMKVATDPEAPLVLPATVEKTALTESTDNRALRDVPVKTVLAEKREIRESLIRTRSNCWF